MTRICCFYDEDESHTNSFAQVDTDKVVI